MKVDPNMEPINTHLASNLTLLPLQFCLKVLVGFQIWHYLATNELFYVIRYCVRDELDQILNAQNILHGLWDIYSEDMGNYIRGISTMRCINCLSSSPVHLDLVVTFTRHMMTSSNGNIIRGNGPLWGEPGGTGGFPSQRPVSRIFAVFFDLHLSKRLSTHSARRRFETSLRSLWRHCNATRASALGL